MIHRPACFAAGKKHHLLYYYQLLAEPEVLLACADITVPSSFRRIANQTLTSIKRGGGGDVALDIAPPLSLSLGQKFWQH